MTSLQRFYFLYFCFFSVYEISVGCWMLTLVESGIKLSYSGDVIEFVARYVSIYCCFVGSNT